MNTITNAYINLDAVVWLGKPGTVCASLLAINANNDAQYEALTWAA